MYGIVQTSTPTIIPWMKSLVIGARSRIRTGVLPLDAVALPLSYTRKPRFRG